MVGCRSRSELHVVGGILLLVDRAAECASSAVFSVLLRLVVIHEIAQLKFYGHNSAQCSCPLRRLDESGIGEEYHRTGAS